MDQEEKYTTGSGSEKGRFSYCVMGAKKLEWSWGLNLGRPDGGYFQLPCCAVQIGAALML